MFVRKNEDELARQIPEHSVNKRITQLGEYLEICQLQISPSTRSRHNGMHG
jgi:hypothetical protein